MRTIAIIGGTGNLGQPVAKQFLADGFEVIIISRDIKKAEKQLGNRFVYREADFTDAASLTGTFEGVDSIYINASGDSKMSYYTNHVIGTRNVLAEVKHQNIECIGMISTASAYPEFTDRWDNKYKLEAEKLIHESGIPYVIFMPSWFMETLPRFQQKNKLMQIGPSKQSIHWLSATDYASVVSQAFQDPACRYKRLPVYGPEAISMAGAIEKYANFHQLEIQKLPIWLTRTLGYLMRDDSLVDVADLMRHYEKAGEKFVPELARTKTTLNQWLQASA